MNKINKIVIIGTGGFPGVPLKIAFPHPGSLPSGFPEKRVNFLEETFELLKRASRQSMVVQVRKTRYREQYDLCVSEPCPNLARCGYCLPYVKVRVHFISYKSGTVQEGAKRGRKAVKILGGGNSGCGLF